LLARGDSDFGYDSVVAHVTSAISGFVRAIALGQAHSVANVLQVPRIQGLERLTPLPIRMILMYLRLGQCM
jgi:hypothetical protein